MLGLERLCGPLAPGTYQQQGHGPEAQQRNGRRGAGVADLQPVAGQRVPLVNLDHQSPGRVVKPYRQGEHRFSPVVDVRAKTLASLYSRQRGQARCCGRPPQGQRGCGVVAQGT